MEKFRIIIGERKGGSQRELSELAQVIRQATAEGSTETAVEQRSLPKETADVGQFTLTPLLLNSNQRRGLL